MEQLPLENQVFVANINYNTSTETLTQAVQQYGELSRVEIKTRRMKGQIVSRGFAFVTYKEKEGADKAKEAKTIELDGRKIRLQAARAKQPRVTAHIRGIVEEITEEDIKAYFQAQNPVSVTIKTPRPRDGATPLRYSFVKFASNEDLMAAIKDVREIEIKGAKLQVSIARSQRPRRNFRRNRRNFRHAPRAQQQPKSE